MSKKSFILHNDSLLIEEKLNDEQLGKLFRAIILYNKGEKIDLPFELELVFHSFEKQFDRDIEKWEKLSDDQRDRANKRWGNINIKKDTDGINGMPPNTKNTADANNVSVSVNDSVSKKVSKNIYPVNSEEVFFYLEEKKKENKFFGDVEKFGNNFFDYYQTAGWIDKSGKLIKNWKLKLVTWISKENLQVPPASSKPWKPITNLKECEF